MISTATLQGAAAFMAALPRAARLPLIGAAGDGALAMEWEAELSLGTLLTIDGGVMHYVLRAGTPQATYHDNLPIAEQLPGDLLDEIQD
jgi:hypothetical protein